MIILDKIETVQGDITNIEVDAIVNAANSSLMGGGGVDGAIHKAGGKSILEECEKIIIKKGKLPTGQAVATNAGNLPAKFVIHTVGPIYGRNPGKEDTLFSRMLYKLIELAAEKGCKSVSFPNISTGVYHFPKAKAAKVSINAIEYFLKEYKTIEKVVLVCFDKENYNLLNEEILNKKN